MEFKAFSKMSFITLVPWLPLPPDICFLTCLVFTIWRPFSCPPPQCCPHPSVLQSLQGSQEPWAEYRQCKLLCKNAYSYFVSHLKSTTEDSSRKSLRVQSNIFLPIFSLSPPSSLPSTLQLCFSRAVVLKLGWPSKSPGELVKNTDCLFPPTEFLT